MSVTILNNKHFDNQVIKLTFTYSIIEVPQHLQPEDIYKEGSTPSTYKSPPSINKVSTKPVIQT